MYYDSLFEFVLDALKWNPERYTESQRAKAIYITMAALKDYRNGNHEYEYPLQLILLCRRCNNEFH